MSSTTVTLAPYQREFIEFALSLGVLRFGTFKLKSGRTSPYFFNAGLFQTSGALSRLADFYAAAIESSGIAYDGLFGPAYKGIPLVSVTAVALFRAHGVDKPYSFNRKEAKDHGEGGTIVGAPLKGQILIVDDVITAGTAVREAFDIIKSNGAAAAGVVVALDRNEVTGGVDLPEGPRPRSAIQEVEHQFGIKVVSIITLEHLLAYLKEKGDMDGALEAVAAYREKYGAL